MRRAEKMDVAVLGTGALGSGALLSLAKRGLKVVGIDRFEPGHERGSSHGMTRVIRKAYFEAPEYVPLLERAYALWDELERESGESLFIRCGVLEVGPPDGEVVPGVLRAAQAHNLPVEALTGAEVERRFPGFHVPEGFAGVFESDGGILRVERCVALQCERAQKLGAELRSGRTILSVNREGSSYLIQTDKGPIYANALVLTAGAWARDLLPELAPFLRVVRKVLLWYPVHDRGPQYLESEGSPVFLFELPQGVFYGFPVIDDFGFKVAEHSGGDEVDDPLALDRNLYERDHAPVDRFLKRFVPNVVPGRASKHAVCMYTLSPDLHPIAGLHPELPHVAFAAGMSGHGFKFSSAFGEALADLALEGSTRHPMDIFAFERLL